MVSVTFLTYLSILTDLLTQLLVCLLDYLPTFNYAYIVYYLFLVVRFIFSLIYSFNRVVWCRKKRTEEDASRQQPR